MAFWAKQAERLSWETPFTEVLDWSDAPFAKWFVGGRLNVAYNCVDRHVEAGNGDRVAIQWEGEPVGDSRAITYRAQDEVCRAANVWPGWASSPGIGGDLHADGARGDHRHAGVRASARDAFGRVRRLLGNGARARIEDAQTRSSSRPMVVPARAGGVAEGRHRRGRGRTRRGNPVEHVLVVRRTGIDVVTPAATCGGAGRWRWHRPTTHRRPSTPSSRCFCSTPRAPRVSPRE